MSGRLRDQAERPVTPGVPRAILATALAVTAGLGCLVAVGVGGHRDPLPGHHDPAGEPRRVPARPALADPDDAATHLTRRQDPLDRPGTAAHRRADRELVSHRALQHVPWHRGAVSIRLVGAKGERAVLSVAGPDRATERRAWASFLHRYGDEGRSYLPRFRSAAGGRS